MKLDNKTVMKLKQDFPIFKNRKNIIYLDNAATTQKPKQVLDSISDFYENNNANVNRGVYSLSEESTEKYERSRETVANFINASKDEIIFTKNTTDSINLLSYSLSSLIKNGKDEIVLTEMEHHSNIIPWQQLAKRNKMKLKFIRISNDFSLDLKDAMEKIGEKTAIVSFSHISNSIGTINPVKEIIKLAKKYSAITIVDAAQSIGHMKVDVKDLNCDFLAFSGHKMMAAFGIGVLYGKKELLNKMHPFEFGGGMIRRVNLEDTEFADSPTKFEAGTPNVEGAITIMEAIKYIDNIGIDNIEKWEKELTEYTIRKLKELDIKIYTNHKNNSGIISINIGKIHPHDVASMLAEHNVCVRAGHHCNMPLMKKLGISGTIRISFYLYNTFDDLDKLIAAIKKIKEKFKDD